MDIHRVVEFLGKKLEKPLPGVTAQMKMAPITRLPENYNPDVSKARIGGVLIYLYPGKDMHTHVLLMKRPVYKGVHSGQVSFPGGKLEKSDKDFVDTALREFHEETGIVQNREYVLGTLSYLYIPPSNFLIHPVVSYALERHSPNPDPKEVEYLIETPLTELLNADNRSTHRITPFTGIPMDAPCFVLGDEIVWGATAMVLSEFAEILRELES